MMKQITVHTALLLALVMHINCAGQNLVPNPSFETYKTCPNNISGLEYSPGYVSFPTVQGWVNPMSSGSADYFNTCATQSSYVSIPGNAFGYQLPRTGNAYIGMIAWEGSNQGGNMVNVFAEYVQCKLNQPMVAGTSYCVTFYVNNGVSPATYNYVGIDKIGVNFSATKATQSTGFTMALANSVISQPGKFLSDTSGWIRINAIYKATGGEEWMTMGWFNNGSAPNFLPVQPQVPNPRDNYRCYLFIDDVSVEKMSTVDTLFTSQDSIACTPDTVFTMTLNSNAQLGDYQWSNGATVEKINISDTGTFWCVASAGCVTYIDTYKVKYVPAPRLDLGKELVNCENQPVTINANYPNSTYQWSTGATTPSITVNSPGVYSLSINNKCGTQTDSVQVYIQPPTPAPAATDTMICQFVDDPVINVSGTDITWYTHAGGVYGSKIQPPVVTLEPGTYALFISQTYGKCESIKVPVNVTIDYTPHEELGDKAVMCENNIELIGKNVAGVDYKWNTGASVCCIYPDREGLYKRAITNVCGSFVDSIWVYHTSCNDCIVFPNAFTPGHEINNIFRPLLKCPVDEFNIQIFNRWGNKVYESNDVTRGWNGRYNYDWGEVGTYVFMVQYRAKGKLQQQVIKGNVTLLR
ncbi:MAG: gliding motility-associated C-terminal domain-containing protein [Chitinophagaceae bacterium]|nr:gliding motility-associated C-terminal domain-containing protein [Chitinophagaceae bacterium]